MTIEQGFMDGVLATIGIGVGLVVLGWIAQDLIAWAMAREIKRYNYISIGGAVRDVAREEAKKQIARELEDISLKSEGEQ